MTKFTIFTDGSSRGNPGPGGWAAIVIDDDVVIELGGRDEATTNNRMEMKAAIEGLKKIPPYAEVAVCTDSAYLLNGITKWVHGWQKNSWKTKTKQDVLNKDLWQELMQEAGKRSVEWRQVSGHSGHAYNERADILATSFADGIQTLLFDGKVGDYENKILWNQKVNRVSGKKGKAGQAYSYVSMINHKVETHKTWAECEKRVKGVRGARYRKALSEAEENEIIDLFKSD